MIKSLHTAATGMQAQNTQMDVIANNIANTSTTGFKKARAEFEDLLYHNEKTPGTVTGNNSVSPNGVQIGMGVKTGSTQRDMGLGSVKMTNREFDLSIEGKGFFQVLKPDGTMAYTRNGEFRLNGEGQVVDANGNQLQPGITVPAEKAGLTINNRGEIAMTTSENPAPQVIGQIELVNFINPTGLKAVGGNLFVSTPSSGEAQIGAPDQGGLGAIAQGQLENSNVNIVEEMVNMITTQRGYETNSKVIQASDQMLQALTHLR